MIQGVHHVAIIAALETSVDFYTKLGFREIFRKKRPYDTIVLMEGHGMQLELFIDPNHPDRAVKPEQKGLRHLALRVDSIEKTAEELGLVIGPVMSDWRGIPFAFTTDPDGLPIELHE